MNKFELHLMYKNETSFTHEPITAVAFISKKSNDIILDSSDYIDPRIIEQLPHDNSGREETLEFPDPEYHKWLEEKIIEMNKEVNKSKYLHDFKSDYEDAKYEINRLEDELDQVREQLEDAESEIRELNNRQ